MEFVLGLHIIDCQCVTISSSKRSFLEEHGDVGHERNGDDGEECGEEEALRHYAFVLPILETEHDAVGGYGHGAEHYCHVANKGIYANECQHGSYQKWEHDEAESGHCVHKTVAQHVTHWDVAEARSDDEQRARDREVAEEVKPLSHRGWNLYATYGDEHGNERRDDARRKDEFGRECAFGLSAVDERHAYGEDEKIERNVEHRGAEHGFRTEHGVAHGVTNEAYVAEGEHELEYALARAVHFPYVGDEVGHADEHHVVYDGYYHEGKEFGVFKCQVFSHHGGEDERWHRNVHNEDGEFAVEVARPEIAL